MTQALKRLISVTGESTITMEVDTRFHYDVWGGGIVDIGYWDALEDTGNFASGYPQDSSVLAAVVDGGEAGIVVSISYYLEANRVARIELPFPSLLGNDVPLPMRIHGPTDDDYLEGIVTAVGRRINISTEQLTGWILSIPGGFAQHGGVFPIGQALTFSFVGRGSPQPVAEATKRVWARLSERGADVGIVIGQEGAGEGAQERITALIRYDPALAIAKEFVDDLGRRWFATSTRTEADRRYLSIEGVRHLTGIDLPEFGVDE